MDNAITKHGAKIAATLGFALLLTLALMLVTPAPAHADWLSDFTGWVSSGLDGFVKDVMTIFTNPIAALANYFLGASVDLLNRTFDSTLLVADFDSLFSSSYGVVEGIHRGVVTSVANVVLATCFVIGLVKVLQQAGRTETGVDAWQLTLVFVFYAFAKAAVDASWDLCIMAYDIVKALINTITPLTPHSTPGNPGGLIPNDLDDLGIALTLVVASIVTYCMCLITALVSHIVVYVRAIQLYVYTAFSPIPLGFLLAESTRPMATGFVKRYLAVMFAGAIMALLFVMMTYYVAAFDIQGVMAFQKDGDLPAYLASLGVSFAGLLAFCWAMFKSGAWAREFVGV